MPPPIRARLPSRPPKPINSITQCRQSSAVAYASPSSFTEPPPIAPLQKRPNYPLTQPPSHKPPELRKSQLLRQYVSLLQSSPLILLFQHNSLTAVEWAALRREFSAVLLKADAALGPEASDPALARNVKIQAIQTSIFAAAMRIVEFYTPSSAQSQDAADNSDPVLTHVLSSHVNAQVQRKKLRQGLQQLIAGPMALVTFPAVQPSLLKAALQVLSPSAPDFPAPRRKTNPGYHEAPVQSAVQKLVLMAARAEGKIYDGQQLRRLGLLMGLEGERGKLVGALEGVAGGLVRNLEGVGMSLWGTLEGRRGMLEEEEKK